VVIGLWLFDIILVSVQLSGDYELVTTDIETVILNQNERIAAFG
jgi:hypothetical protein